MSVVKITLMSGCDPTNSDRYYRLTSTNLCVRKPNYAFYTLTDDRVLVVPLFGGGDDWVGHVSVRLTDVFYRTHLDELNMVLYIIVDQNTTDYLPLEITDTDCYFT